ncbi:hypothetical protein LTR17_011168 [Elasticomyces elasticus]|nr:hypothetical protein LTR17_011168 [Elasticomyces elasticus]
MACPRGCLSCFNVCGYFRGRADYKARQAQAVADQHLALKQGHVACFDEHGNFFWGPPGAGVQLMGVNYVYAAPQY